MLEPQNGGLYALLTAEVASALGLPEGAFLSTGASPIETARAYPIAAAALGTDERRGAADGLGRAVRRHALDLLWGAIAAIGRRAQRAMLPAELAVRRAQVQERLSARVGAEMVAALVVETDVDKHEVPVQRRTKDGTVTLRRRAADGELEGPRCSGCGASVLKLYLCDQSLHALCSGCGQPGRIEPGHCRGCRPRPAQPWGRCTTVPEPSPGPHIPP